MARNQSRLIEVSAPLSKKANKQANIVNYDSDNLYPQRLDNLINQSKTALRACGKMVDNIVCNGFTNEAVASKENDNGYTLNEILRSCANDFARFGGACLIIQYNALGEAVNVYHVPTTYVRVELNDDYKRDSKVRKYRVFNNWEKSSDMDTDTNHARIYNAYNPDKVLEEIEECGGIGNYQGQLLYIKESSFKTYPLSPFHAVQAEMYSEYSNGLQICRTLEKGFHSCNVIEHGRFEDGEDGGNNEDAFFENFVKMTGADNASSFVIVENTGDGSNPFIRSHAIGTPINADTYRAYTEPIRKDICIAAYNIPIALIDNSVVSFSNASGASILELRKLYREELNGVRTLLSTAFAKVFDYPTEFFEIDAKLNNAISEIEQSSQSSESMMGRFARLFKRGGKQ